MDTYVIPLTFPDLDTAERDADSLVGALHAAGMHAEMVGLPGLEADDDGARPDPGPTTRELHVHATSPEEAVVRVQQVVNGQLPPGLVLLGEPTRL